MPQGAVGPLARPVPQRRSHRRAHEPRPARALQPLGRHDLGATAMVAVGRRSVPPAERPTAGVAVEKRRERPPLRNSGPWRCPGGRSRPDCRSQFCPALAVLRSRCRSWPDPRSGRGQDHLVMSVQKRITTHVRTQADRRPGGCGQSATTTRNKAATRLPLTGPTTGAPTGWHRVNPRGLRCGSAWSYCGALSGCFTASSGSTTTCPRRPTLGSAIGTET